MSWVAVAIAGSAVVGGVLGDKSADRAADAAETGASESAAATLEATRMQLAEIARQFDYQQQLVRPFAQQQLDARSHYQNMLGIPSSGQTLPDVPSAGGGQVDTVIPQASRDVIKNALRSVYEAGGDPSDATTFGNILQAVNEQYGGAGGASGTTFDNATGKPVVDPLPTSATQPPPIEGPFRDPNLDPTRLGADTGAESELGQHVAGSYLAGATPEEDLAVRRADDVRLAAPGGFRNDPRFQFAESTAVVGDEFETSPGYDFTVEQAMREVERRNSRGGNYGGRALVEAQRRAEGEAAKEYYNWVNARHADLGRQDQAIGVYQGREATDVARGDAALDDYFGRKAGDVGRMDQAIVRNDALREYDLRRGDQGYYNYLASLGGASGLNVGVPQAVASSADAGAYAAGAYGTQGGRLSSIYSGLGTDRANIELGRGANLNDAIQSGLQNYLFYQAAA